MHPICRAGENRRVSYFNGNGGQDSFVCATCGACVRSVGSIFIIVLLQWLVRTELMAARSS